MKYKTQSNQGLKDQVLRAFDVPTEIVKNLPKIVMIGNQELNIENFSKLIEYTPQQIKMSTASGTLVVSGNHLEIYKMTMEYIIIRGYVVQISFIV